MPSVADTLNTLAEAVLGVKADAAPRVADSVRAAAFHAERQPGIAPIVALVGGTGTGKSTLVNRLLRVPDRGDEALVATSFRRTFTAGPVAIADEVGKIPPNWLGLPICQVATRGAKGDGDHLTFLSLDSAPDWVLVDTPDLDGDQAEHHARAERVFRWADVIVLVATPEKYQLPEVSRFADLADRWGVPRLFVMNKADDVAAAEDWARQLDVDKVFVVPRDDASLTMPSGRGLDELRDTLSTLSIRRNDSGIRTRIGDACGRVQDLVLEPARERLQRVVEVKSRLEALVRPEPGVNVHPMTRHLQRRLQRQSVLYLMGPGRMIDRVRSLPGTVARMPRSAWDLLTRGKLSMAEPEDVPSQGVPDFGREVADAFDLFVTRCQDAIGEGDATPWRIDRSEAEAVVQHQLDELRQWLEARWDAKPRDTRALEWLAKHVPGGKHVTKLSETAPYLLIAASAATSFVTAGAEQVAIGGYLLTTWLGEKLSNEVAARTRQANAAIQDDFAALCNQQVAEASAWLDANAPDPAAVKRLDVALAKAHRLTEVR